MSDAPHLGARPGRPHGEEARNGAFRGPSPPLESREGRWKATAEGDRHDRPHPSRPGDVARRTRAVRAEDVASFTELTGDRNPVHDDAALAGRSRFGGIVVQGGVTTGLLDALVAEDLPGPGSVFVHVDGSFRAPVRPGDLPTTEARVLQVRADTPVCTPATSERTADDTVLVGTAVVRRDPVVARAVATGAGGSVA